MRSEAEQVESRGMSRGGGTSLHECLGEIETHGGDLDTGRRPYSIGGLVFVIG
jgi:hypothetical protein